MARPNAFRCTGLWRCSFKLDDSILKNKAGEYDETKVTIEPAKEMYVFGEGGHLPANALKNADEIRKVLKRQQ